MQQLRPAPTVAYVPNDDWSGMIPDETFLPSPFAEQGTSFDEGRLPF
ncbi:MAG: hypothetical protein R3C05_02675 [Pirellulaceae bacterium]